MRYAPRVPSGCPASRRLCAHEAAMAEQKKKREAKKKARVR